MKAQEIIDKLKGKHSIECKCIRTFNEEDCNCIHKDHISLASTYREDLTSLEDYTGETRKYNPRKR